MDHNINLFMQMILGNPCGRVVKTLEGHNPPTENHSARAIPTHVGKIGADFYMNPGAMCQSVKSIWKPEKKM